MWPFTKKYKHIPANPGLIRSPRDVEYDPRKASLMALPVASEPRPEEFFGLYSSKHVEDIEYDQDGLGCCVAESGSRYIGILSYKETNQFIKPSVQALMAFIKHRIEKDNSYGATIESCPKALKQFGVPLEIEYPSNYSLSWNDFIEDSYIPISVETSGLRQRIETYAWTDSNNLESIKVGVYHGQGNIVQGGAIGSNAGWKGGELRVPLPGETIWGHAIDFFGYDKDYVYFINSWSYNWGLTLYLRSVETSFGKFYIKGDINNYDLKIKGVGRMGKDYEGLDSSNDPYLFRGLTYIDLPDDVAAQTKMLKTVQVKDDNRVYAVQDGFYYWITSDRMYIAFLNKIFAPYVVVDKIDPTKVIGTFNKEY
jgi:hypothetical protein